jgi:uncharacterized protein YgiM (DUF1202 family)
MAAEVSIGNELKDAFKQTQKWVKNGAEWLTDIEEFYRERAIIEKEYSQKLKELCKRHFDKKAQKSSSLSVGDSPTITPGSLESASLVLWTDVLTQSEAIADEKLSFSKELSGKISDNFVALKLKSLRIATQIESIEEHLTSEKKKTEDEVTKRKKQYDALCQTTENTREKTEKGSSEKYQAKLEQKKIDMNIGKNDYIIQLSIANRLKDKYYYQDLPEILDYLQELNESRVGILNKLLKNANIIERNSSDRIKEKLHLIDTTIEQNDPKLDSAMFIKHNSESWKEPSDFVFIPCSFWHDDENLVTKEPELTNLKKRLGNCIANYSKIEEYCMSLKQDLEESTATRKGSQDNLTLKFDGNLSSTLGILMKFMKEDGQRVKTEVEIETIQNYTGDQDMSYVEQAPQKKSKFGFLKRHTSSHEGQTSDVQSVHTVKSNHTFTPSGIFNLRRNKSVASSSTNGGRALYAYAAAGDDEVSINPGDDFTVLEADDGGWTKIQLSSGMSGLVPTSYIELTGESSSPTPAQAPIVEDTTGGSKKKGPSVAPKRGAKRVQYVEALYDYSADGDDEITITAGDRIVLIQDDTDGSGWTEGELNGERGMFPTSYVRKV